MASKPWPYCRKNGTGALKAELNPSPIAIMFGGMTASVDPDLVAAIASAKKRKRHVHAAFTLRRKRGKALSPEDTDEIVKKIVKKASDDTKTSAEKLVVFKNLQSFSINAPADLVEKLASEDDIGTAALGS